MTTTVLVVDDRRDFRALARLMLESAGFDVIGEASSAGSALSAVGELGPDVVLLDVRLPDGSGADVARAVRGLDRPPLIVLTSTADYDHIVAECGATAFIPKHRLSGESFRAAIGAA